MMAAAGERLLTVRRKAMKWLQPILSPQGRPSRRPKSDMELAAPFGGSSIALVQTGADLPVGIDTGIRFVTPDARAAHAALAAKGLAVGDLLDWETAPLMFSFVDADGNRFYVTQRA